MYIEKNAKKITSNKFQNPPNLLQLVSNKMMISKTDDDIVAEQL